MYFTKRKLFSPRGLIGDVNGVLRIIPQRGFEGFEFLRNLITFGKE